MGKAETKKRLIQQAMPKLSIKERIRSFREVTLGYTREQAVAEAKRCLKCKEPKCVEGCPVGVDIPGFIKLTEEGKFEEAIKKIKEKTVCPTSVEGFVHKKISA